MYHARSYIFDRTALKDFTNATRAEKTAVKLSEREPRADRPVPLNLHCTTQHRKAEPRLATRRKAIASHCAGCNRITHHSRSGKALT